MPNQDIKQHPETEKYYRKKSGSRKPLIIILIMLFTICFAAGGIIAVRLFMPSFTVDPYYNHVRRGEPDEFSLVYGNEAVPDNYYALSYEDDVLMDIDFLRDYGIDDYLFWDSEEGVLTVSTPLKIIRMRPEEAFYTQNGEKRPFPVANTALRSENGKIFLPVSFAAEFYQIDCHISREMKTLVVDNRLVSMTKANVKRAASVRYEPDIKSDIAEKLKKGSEIRIYGEEKQGFYAIRTQNGALGWLKTGDIQNITQIPAEEKIEEEAPRPAFFGEEPLMLLWDQISGDGGSGNNWISSKNESINVVSPTWLSLENGSGEIKDAGSKEYAQKAIASGYELWPLFSNGFDADMTHEALKSTSKREKIIVGLTEILRKYGAGGVNIDFESYRIEDGYYYTQFLKELSVYLRGEGFAVSVDLPVPTLQNSPTSREQIGKFVDYVIVMAYDQHWAASQVKGPVAGYDWVRAGIENTVSLVPSEKVVLGLPLYTRIWYQPVEGGSVTSRDFAMKHVSDLFETRNADLTWEENTKYNRGQYEYDVDGARNIITAWLETVESLRYKAEIVNELDLAGAACWKKGLEDEQVWNMLAETIK